MVSYVLISTDTTGTIALYGQQNNIIVSVELCGNLYDKYVFEYLIMIKASLGLCFVISGWH